MDSSGIRRYGVVGTFVSALLVCNCSFGDTAAATEGESASTSIRVAKSHFRPLTDADSQAALIELKAAAAELEQRFVTAGDSAAGWRDYLVWDKFRTELNNSVPDSEFLTRIHGKLSAGHEGLEIGQFVRVREALRRYLQIRLAIGNSKVGQDYPKYIDQLADLLDGMAKHPTSDSGQQVADLVSWLESFRQSPEVIQTVRSRFGYPNLDVQVNGSVLGLGIAGPVDEVAPVDDVIMGTVIHGTGRTIGMKSSVLVPDSSRAMFDAIMVGNNSSQTTGCNGPVVIYSNGSTSLGAAKRFWFDDSGLHALAAVARANTCTTITCIQDKKGRKFVEKIAWRKAGQQKSEAESIASSHAMWRLSQRVNAQAESEIVRANDRFNTKVRGPLTERAAYPREVKFSTASDAIRIIATEATADQLAAPSPAPGLMESSDVSLRVHESSANNIASTVLSGMRLRDDMLAATLLQLLGRVPDEFKLPEGEPPWTIVFARQQPITVSFADNGYTVTVRGREFYRGDQSYPGMNITASYKIVKSDKGFKFVRDGELQIFPPGFVPGSGHQLSVPQQAIRTLLQKRLGKSLKPEIVAEGIKFEGPLAAAGKFMPVEINSHDGWLAIGWRRTATEPAAAVTQN